MRSQKFLTNYKCECYEQNYCNCPHKAAANAIFLDNINDIADALAQVMIICGIHQCKAKAAVDVIVYSFLHYDEIRHRIDTVPRKRLCKEDLVHDLGRKCLMNRMEAQLTYSIIKRAFKAFYHGTCEGGIRNPILEAQLVHSQECLWVHAAKRTAQIFASYEGMFYSAQRNYEAQIKCVYKHLYDRMRERADPVELDECSCKGCMKRAVVDLPKPTRSHFSMHDAPMLHSNITYDDTDSSKSGSAALHVFKKDAIQENTSETFNKVTNPPSNTSLHLARCYECNCPKLICDCEVDRKTGVLSAECSQGPFKCQWVRMDENEKLSDPCIEIPEDHQCPVDCDEDSVICDPECECDCDVCECPADESSDYEDNDSADIEKEEEELVEPTPSGQCDLTDSELEPLGQLPVAHVVEEEGENPTSLAKVEGHKKAASISFEQLEEKQEGGEELMQIVGNVI